MESYEERMNRFLAEEVEAVAVMHRAEVAPEAAAAEPGAEAISCARMLCSDLLPLFAEDEPMLPLYEFF